MNSLVGEREMAKKQAYSAGFTIVELLIVIVVIGILAAITIVSYNGITQKALATVAQSAVSQASDKVQVYAVQNNDTYPATLADAGITDTDTATYQYSVNTLVSPQTYCVTATAKQTVSYFKNNTTQLQPAAGACPGHSLNGQAVITNYAPNPSVETDLTGFSNYAGPGGAATLTRETSGGHDGPAFARQQWTAPQTGVSAFGPSLTVPSLTQNTAYSVGVWVRSNKAQRLHVSIEWYNGSDGFVGLAYGTAVDVAANTWTRLTNSNAVSPANAVKGVVFVRNDSNGGGASGTLWATNDTFDIDGIMFMQGATLSAFADGNTANWSWTGTANKSSSSGPST